MASTIRGADLLVRALERAGIDTVFTLSGNHIMRVFDAVLGTGIKLVHVRHEAAVVHMADAWGRLTGRCGIALVTGGPGHANAVGALFTALAADSPLVLLSGHAGLKELGRGAFQEMRQAEMAAPVCKASWTARSARTLGHELAEAVRMALSGRPGPVHLSLPFDLLDEVLDDDGPRGPEDADFEPEPQPLGEISADAVLAALAGSERPLVLAGPMLCQPGTAPLLEALAAASGIPAIGMESPRGINDPSLGAFAEVLRRADLILLLGKPHDFTLRFAEPPFADPDCRFVVIDPDGAMIERVAREKGPRLVFSAVADAPAAAADLARRAGAFAKEPGGWAREVGDAIAYRPEAWKTLTSRNGKLHPVELCRAIQPHLDASPGAIFVCDGGEIGQWAQSLLCAPRRVINGVAGSIGAALPFALAARCVEREAPVIAVMGDGTFGFHMAEFDTAIRYGLPLVVVVGNDAAWNAEYQIQLREYGESRAHGCDLLPARYDRVVEALGGHGEWVTQADELGPALERALASGKPACVNVMIERVAAPVLRREPAHRQALAS